MKMKQRNLCTIVAPLTLIFRCDAFAPIRSKSNANRSYPLNLPQTLQRDVRNSHLNRFNLLAPIRQTKLSDGDDDDDDVYYDHNHDHDQNTSITMSRREALITSASVSLASLFLMTSDSSASAQEVTLNDPSISKSNAKTTTLTDLSLGDGQWTSFKEAQNNIALQPFARNVIPPNFATYVSRFLITYDTGVKSWWEGNEKRYSLLPAAEARKRLGKDFGSFARSNQISLGNYVIGIDNANANGKGEIKLNNDAEIQQKFEELLRVFVNAYASYSYGSTDKDDAKRHLGLLFSTLPPKYQPVSALKELFPTVDGENVAQPSGKVSVAYTEALTQLLPSKFMPYYDATTDSFTIQPSLSLYELGVSDEFGQNAIATIFGPLSSAPLKRERPEQSLAIYSLLGLSGGLGCALTHSLVIPVDVVKTRLQSDPDRYSNIYDGAVNIAQTEGIRGFSLGAQATIAGYFWYGLSVYPSYAFSKWFLTNVMLDPALAMANTDGIALLAGAIAAVIASLGLTPLEACRIRTVSEPDIYRDIGLVGTATAIAKEDSSLGWKALYAGLPSLLTRQIIFGSVKFLAYERACEAFFLAWPFLRDTTATVLGVTIVAGALSGALSSVVSQPADSVLTYVANNKGGNGAAFGVIEGCQVMVKNEGVASLFRGLGSRCVWAALIISGQFFLYDIFKNALGINADDLSEVFQFIINRS